MPASALTSDADSETLRDPSFSARDSTAAEPQHRGVDSCASSAGSASPGVDVKKLLSDPDIEGDPLRFLKVSEAYWKVG